LTAELSTAGITFEALDNSSFATASARQVSDASAVSVATNQFGTDGNAPVLYKGRVTSTGAGIQNSPMFVVELAGRTLHSHGSRYGPNGSPIVQNDTVLHEQLLVFIDAATGTLVFATSLE